MYLRLRLRGDELREVHVKVVFGLLPRHHTSSSSRIFGFLRIARAMATRCF